jgi:putative PEP-CTERM system TPR-repeat lipoprotein
VSKFNYFVIASLVSLLISCGGGGSFDEYMKSGVDYYKKAQWKSAVIEFKNAVKLEPKDARARALLGQSYIEVNDFPAAIKELSRAQDLGFDRNQLVLPLAKAYLASNQSGKILEEIKASNDQSAGVQARLHAIRARALLSKDKKDEAYEELKTARDIDDTAQEVRLAWAVFEQSRGNHGAQMDWIKPLLEKDGGVAEAWSQKGDIDVTKKDFEEAEKSYSRAIEAWQIITPDLAKRALARIELKKFDEAQQDIDLLKTAGLTGPVVLQADAVIAFRQGRQSEAGTKFQEIVSQYPKYAPAKFMLALLNFAEGDYNSAHAHLNLYTQTNPENVQAQFLLAVTSLQLQKPEKTLEIVNNFLRNSATDSRLYGLKGSALAQLGKADEAISTLKQGLLLDPQNSDLHFRLGLIQSRKPGEVSQAQEHLKQSIALSESNSKAELALFMSYVREKDFKKAQDYAKSLAQKEGREVKGQNLLGLAYLAEGKTDLAISEFENILQENELDEVTVKNLARVYMNDNRLEDAKKLLSKAVEQNPQDMDSMTQLAAIAARQGHKDEMLNLLSQSVQNNPDELSPKLLLAVQYLKENDATKAIQVLNAVEGENKDNPTYLLLMSQAKLQAGEHQHSIRLLKTLLAKHDTSALGHFLLAQAYSADKDAQRMEEELERTLELAPDHQTANIYLARLNLLQGKKDSFRKRLQHLQKIAPGAPDVQLLTAKSHAMDGAFKKSIEILEPLSKQSANAELHMDLAGNYAKVGQRDRAIGLLEQWIGKNGQDTRVKLQLAQLYMEAESFTKARELYQKLEKEFPENFVILNNLAWLMKDVDINAGIGFGERALKIQPDNAFVQDTVAMLHLQNGSAEKALLISSKAARALPQVVEVQINHAKILAANNRKSEARKVLNDVLKTTNSQQSRALIKKEIDSL